MKYTSIAKAVELLNKGEVVAFPTETVYGLGADAWNESAVKKIFKLKERPSDNPLIVHIASREMVKAFAKEIHPEAEKLMDRFWPGPLTLIFKKKDDVLDVITGGLDTVALRWPGHPISQELIFRASALVAPSANKSGKPSPTRAEHVREDFGDDFPVIDGGETQIGLESTVLDTSVEPFIIYRPGFVEKYQIEEVIGSKVELIMASPEDTAKSPGTKYSHYAPEARVKWLEDEDFRQSDSVLFLLHNPATSVTKADNIIHFKGNYRKFANDLYDCFRKADQEGYSEILIEPFEYLDTSESLPELVEALRNRINKATT